jgi:predicted RNase H-like HicB family nuclease
VEGIELMVETMIADGLEIPLPKPLSVHHENPDYAGWT